MHVQKHIYIYISYSLSQLLFRVLHNCWNFGISKTVVSPSCSHDHDPDLWQMPRGIHGAGATMASCGRFGHSQDAETWRSWKSQAEHIRDSPSTLIMSYQLKLVYHVYTHTASEDSWTLQFWGTSHFMEQTIRFLCDMWIGRKNTSCKPPSLRKQSPILGSTPRSSYITSETIGIHGINCLKQLGITIIFSSNLLIIINHCQLIIS